MNDVDFNVDGIRIHRKGGKEVIIYFGDEVELALRDYMEERRHIVPAPGNEEALFLSMQKKRLNVRSVENLVKKYAQAAAPLKRLRLTNCAVLTERICTGKLEIFIW